MSVALGTAIVGACVLVVLGLLTVSLIRQKKRGGCCGCPMSDSCHGKCRGCKYADENPR